jgi:CheY-like chemotaxis protein
MASTVSNLKILIVEDNEASEKLLSILMKAFSNEIFIARTGIQAIDICRKKTDLDLILMDIGLPELDGYAATREIRTFNPKVIIISQTANGLTGDFGKSIEAGCNDYLLKPIQKNKLYAMINKYFDRT